MRDPRPRTESSVLVPTYDVEEGDVRACIVVLLRRAAGGTHGNQLAFPGGKWEPGDATPLDAALRETEEELGLSPREVLRTEPLPIVDTYTTRFRIHPFLARIQPPDQWAPDPREVAEVIEVRAIELCDRAARGTMEIPTPGYAEGTRFPYIQVGAHRLWGATYRILEPLLPRLVGVDDAGSSRERG